MYTWLTYLFMANDPEARKIPINFEGGTVVMTIGMARNLFSDDPQYISPVGKDKDVTVKNHTRTRVIGGPSAPVAGYSYSYKQWPALPGGNSSGGEAIMMSWDGSDGWWTARLHGSAHDFGTFLNETSPAAVLFKTERGTTYGPFLKTIL
jgi:hypothetical protein